MARSLESDDYEIDFFYAMERGDQGYFLDELYEIADRHPRFRVTPIKRDTLGHITADDIEGVSSKLPEMDILISGPLPMIESLSRQFQKKGVPKSQIHFEKFSFTGK